jgi:1-phosphofructokinase family hexose kinase
MRQADLVAVAPSPALDRVVLAPGAAGGGTVRVAAEGAVAGGKALNACRTARALGATVHAVAALAGDRGARLEAMLREEGLPCTPLRLAVGETRETITVLDGAAADVLELLGPPPPFAADDAERLCGLVDAVAGDARVVAACGSLPPGAPADLFARIVARARAAGAAAVVDSSGVALAAALGERPDLVTPNAAEVGAVLQTTLAEDAPVGDLAAAALELRERGAAAVLVTIGRRGALLATAAGVLLLRIDEPPAPLNRVGCGDALVGGTVAGLARGSGLAEAAALGVAAATERLTRGLPGPASPPVIAALARRVRMRPLEAAEVA